MSHTDTPWVTIELAAKHYSVSPDTIRRMITRGEIEGRRFGPRLIRVQIPSILTAAHPLQFFGGDAE